MDLQALGSLDCAGYWRRAVHAGDIPPLPVRISVSAHVLSTVCRECSRRKRFLPKQHGFCIPVSTADVDAELV